MTAENYNAEAEENDGSCIAARPKLIGNYTYTKLWRDTIGQADSIDFGVMQITQSNTASNAFLLNRDGSDVFRGVISAFDIVMDPYTETGTYFGFPYTRNITGNGEWLLGDTVDLRLTIRDEIMIVDGNPLALRKVPQPYNYYLTKVN